MTIETITPITYTPPERTQNKDDFDTNIEAAFPAIKTLTTELVVSIPQMNTDIAQANTDASAASTSAALASGAANFVGNWSDQTGAANVPYSVAHAGVSWILLENLADVTAEEPTDASTKWQQDSVEFEEVVAISLYF